MKIAIVIRQNQNEVNKSEIEKIRRAVKSAHPGCSTKIYANENVENVEFSHGIPVVKESEVMFFSTHDVNGKVWATLEYSTVNSTVYSNIHTVSL